MNVLETVIKAISEKKGEDIVVYDTQSITPFMDHMIIASSDNVRQNASLAQNIKDRLWEAGYTGDFKMEGTKESRWILVDLRDIVVHLFAGDERNLYQLEKLYSGCPHHTED